MKIVFAIALLALTGCASSSRVLVKDCQDLAGAGDMKNCELIRKL
jgi:uncharacterized protein YcfL